jgi:hypothetical protein
MGKAAVNKILQYLNKPLCIIIVMNEFFTKKVGPSQLVPEEKP